MNGAGSARRFGSTTATALGVVAAAPPEVVDVPTEGVVVAASTKRLIADPCDVPVAETGRSSGVAGICSELEPNPVNPPRPRSSDDPAIGVCAPGATDDPEADAGCCPSISAMLSSIHGNIRASEWEKQRCGGWVRYHRPSETMYFTRAPGPVHFYNGSVLTSQNARLRLQPARSTAAADATRTANTNLKSRS
jgi:hypothetical protein